ncbi:MAG: peroxiredoxin-like family protein [Polyangiaceae bacterium]
MRTSILLLAAVALGGCNESSSSPTPEPTKASASSPLASVTTSPSSSSEAEKPKQPMAKETSDTPTDHLGKLPDGVGLEVGSALPTLKLKSSKDDEVDVNALAKTGPLMLVFYRGGWCPFCNYQIHSLAKAYPEFQKRGVTPVAISVDLPSEASKTQSSWEIPFPVLSDPELVAHKAFNVLNQLDDAGLAKLKGYGIDVEARSGQKHHTIAIPSIFIIDDGKVAWAHAETDYKTRPSTTQLLKVIDDLKLR